MKWTAYRIKEIGLKHYFKLHDYQIGWQTNYETNRIKQTTPSYHAWWETHAIMNAEFDLGIRNLGELGAFLFVMCILNNITIQEVLGMRVKLELLQKYSVLKIMNREAEIKQEFIQFLLDSNKPQTSRLSEAYRKAPVPHSKYQELAERHNRHITRQQHNDGLI